MGAVERPLALRVVADLEGPLERPQALRVVGCRVIVAGAQPGVEGLSLLADLLEQVRKRGLLEAWLREPSRLLWWVPRLVRYTGN